MRVGILGGAFNPPHLGHLVCAHEAIAELDLDRLMLVPMGSAPHRQIEQDPGAEVRLELCRRAAAAHERLEASSIEVDRAGPSYTVDTLAELREHAPGDELFLVLGGDQAGALGSWRDPEQVLGLATIAAVERAGWPRQRIAEGLSGLEGADRVVFLDVPRIDVSSTLVRRRVAEGRPIGHLVPHGVADLIADRGLYARSAPVAAE